MELNNKKIYSLVGLATKSRNVVSGEFSTEKAVKSGDAKLVLIGEDASDNTKKMFRNMCEFYEVPIRILGSKEELGHAMGKELRASLAVLDSGFAKSILKYLEEPTPMEVVENGENKSS